MNQNNFSWDLFNTCPIIGIVRGMSMEDIMFCCEVFNANGFGTFEVTLNTPNALKTISTLREAFPKMNIGAGTITSVEAYNQAKTAGAQFVVTPVSLEDVIKKSVADNIPIFPGAFTPTEIFKAHQLGANAIKVFPANQLGAGYIKNVLAPLNQVKLIPTGGVSKENIKSFFNAGATGVGMGSSLLNKQLIADKDSGAYAQLLLAIKEEIKEFL